MRLIIIGAGGHGRSVAEAVLLEGRYKLLGFADDSETAPDKVWNFPVLGSTALLAEFRARAEVAIVAIGNNTLRESVHRKLIQAGFVLGTVVHPRAFVSRSAKLGVGCTIMAGAVVGTESLIGDGVIVNCGAVIDHHCNVSDFAHLGVNACMSGASSMGVAAWMQAGSALGHGVTLAAGTVLPPNMSI